LMKPFDCRELLARVRSVLRRSAPRPGAAEHSGQKTIASASTGPRGASSFGPANLNLLDGRFVECDGKAVKLTSMERDLLDVLARHPNKVLSRQQLLDKAHFREEEPFDRSIDIRITRIRRKIEKDPSRPQMIKTVRGCGYVFVPPAAERLRA
jgi:DNA-binding response OmpR family regulator